LLARVMPRYYDGKKRPNKKKEQCIGCKARTSLRWSGTGPYACTRRACQDKLEADRMAAAAATGPATAPRELAELDDNTRASEPAARAEAESGVLEKGQECFYQNKNSGEALVVTILKVHFDDAQPYYTIGMPDGGERATVRERLSAINELESLSLADLFDALPTGEVEQMSARASSERVLVVALAEADDALADADIAIDGLRTELAAERARAARLEQEKEALRGELEEKQTSYAWLREAYLNLGRRLAHMSKQAKVSGLANVRA